MAEVFTPGSSLAGICRWLEETLDSERSARRGSVRVPGQAVLRPLRHPGLAGRLADTVDEAVAAGRRGRLPGRRQGPGPGRRPGQGRRHQAGQRRRRGPRCTPGTSSAWTSRATSSSGSGSSTPRDIAEEYYASFTLDRSAKKHLLMLSAQGGVEIEEVAEPRPGRHRPAPHRPGRRARRSTPPATPRSTPRSTRTRVDGVAEILRAALPLLHRGRLRPGRDQPADPQPDGEVHALDAKVSLDDNAAFRHPGVGRVPRRPRSSTSASSWPGRRTCSTSGSRARSGIIANGAGLAMSTLDVVNQVGGTRGQLPRHRRRRQRRRDGGGARGHQLRPERAARSSSTSSAASPAARRWPRASSRRSAGSTCGPRSSSASTAPTPRRAAQILADAGIPEIEADLQAHHARRRPRRRRPRERNEEAEPWPSSSTQTPRSSCRASPAARAATTACATGPTAPRSWPASRPGKGGQDVEGIPVFDTVAEAVAATGADASFVAVPPKAASAAILEAAAAGIGFIVCITEGIPAQDEAKVFNTLVRDYPGTPPARPELPRASSAPASATSASPPARSPSCRAPAGPTSASSRARAR